MHVLLFVFFKEAELQMCPGTFSCELSAALAAVRGREAQLGAGQSGHAGELAALPGSRPGQGEAVLLSSALRQPVRRQRALGAQPARLAGPAWR